MTIVIELFQLFSSNIFEGESFPSAASPLCSISAAPSGTSSRLRSLTIYNSQIFTSSRYSDIQIFTSSSRLRSQTIYKSLIFTSSKSSVSAWHCVTFFDPLICISETHIMNITDTFVKVTLRNIFVQLSESYKQSYVTFCQANYLAGHLSLCSQFQMYCLTFFIIFHFFCNCSTSYPAVLQKVCC